MPLHIPLGKTGLNAIIDEIDMPLIAGYKWYLLSYRGLKYAIANAKTTKGKHTTIRMHRLLLPGFSEVDHKDGNGLNNTQGNLRGATHQQNLRNTIGRSNRRSPYKGVALIKRNGIPKWRARITVNGVSKHIGCFDTAEQAAIAFNTSAKEYHGDFVRPNMVKEDLCCLK